MAEIVPPRRGADRESLRVDLSKRECAILASLDGLRAWLCVDRFPDGAPRQTSSMTVFVEEGLVKVWLNDKECRRSCCLTGETLSAALTALDDALVSGKADWRPDRARSTPRR